MEMEELDMNIENLWGDIPKGENLKTPVAILREQAAILGEATDNLLVADVVPNKQKESMTLHFYVTAPALDNYRFHLFQVDHQIELYPLEVETDEVVYQCSDENSFKGALKAILSSPKVHRIISSLLAQSKEVGKIT